MTIYVLHNITNHDHKTYDTISKCNEN